ncbi:hypothetical protein ABT299_51690 [Spirillospora sp. NPDC000708]
MDYRALNRALWDERVAIHVASDFYDVAGFRAGGTALRDFEIAEVGDVAGRRFHPFANILDEADGTTVAYDYFDTSPQVWDEPGTYTDGDQDTRNTRSVQFHHGIGEVVSALAAAGLRVDFLHEHDHTLFRRFTSLERDGAIYRLPAGRPRVPLMYSLRATRPADG